MSRIAKLVAHRSREVDAAMNALEEARELVALAHSALAETHARMSTARAAMGDALAGELHELESHIRSLAIYRQRLVSRLENARREEQHRRAAVLDARIELKKMESLEQSIARAAASEEDRVAQRAIDDRFGALTARRRA
jgi:flagellar export protein FliJ